MCTKNFTEMSWLVFDKKFVTKLVYAKSWCLQIGNFGVGWYSCWEMDILIGQY